MMKQTIEELAQTLGLEVQVEALGFDLEVGQSRQRVTITRPGRSCKTIIEIDRQPSTEQWLDLVRNFQELAK